MTASDESNLHRYIEEGQVDDYKDYVGQLFEYPMASWYMVAHDYDDESRQTPGKRLARHYGMMHLLLTDVTQLPINIIQSNYLHVTLLPLVAYANCIICII